MISSGQSPSCPRSGIVDRRRWRGAPGSRPRGASAASIAALFGLWQLHLVPRPSGRPRWWHEHRDLGPRFLAEAFLRTILVQIALIGIGVIAGIAPVGYIRGAQLLMAPIQIVFLGLVAVLVPEGVRAAAHGAGTLRRLVVAVSAGQLGLAVAWTLMVVRSGFSVIGPLVLGSWLGLVRALCPAGGCLPDRLGRDGRAPDGPASTG